MEKKFHLQEMDWVITFPNTGNRGKKYPDYSVMLSDLKKGSSDKNVCLRDIVENVEFESKFPHTVGFSKVRNLRLPRCRIAIFRNTVN